MRACRQAVLVQVMMGGREGAGRQAGGAGTGDDGGMGGCRQAGGAGTSDQC